MMRSGRFLRVVVLFVCLYLCGCARYRNVVASESDSLRVEIVERQVVVHDTVEVEIPRIEERHVVYQDSSHLSNRLAHSTAIIQPDGALFHSLETYPQKITHPTTCSVQVRDSIIFRERIVRQPIEVEREMTSWQLLQIRGFWSLLLAFVALLCMRW